jgi:hypothetical protein
MGEIIKTVADIEGLKYAGRYGIWSQDKLVALPLTQSISGDSLSSQWQSRERVQMLECAMTALITLESVAFISILHLNECHLLNYVKTCSVW